MQKMILVETVEESGERGRGGGRKVERGKFKYDIFDTL
jgi:hypothetical protein